MSVTRRRFAHAALMASASFLSLTFASEAQAQCVTSPGSPPLNNLPNDAVVTCSGAVTGQTIILNGISVDVNVDAGTTLSNSTVTINGPDGRVNFRSTAGPVTTLLNVTTTSPGNPVATNVRFTNVSGTNIVAQVGGQVSNLRFLSSSAITAVPGNITLTGATNNPGPGGNGVLSVEGGSSIFALGAANGSYLLATGAGNETVLISDSDLLAASDGLLISTGAGSDLINIWGDSTLASFGGAAVSIDGGADFDRIRWRGGTGAVTHNAIVTNIEEAIFETPSGGAPLVIRGTADYATVFIGGVGTTRFDDITALGANTAAVQVVSGATLQLNANAVSSLDHVFSGTGTIRQTDGVNTYNGNSSAFAGTFIIDSSQAILGNANAVGTADITNNATLSFGGFGLANDISGTGQVIVTGTGNSFLSGTNTFSGGLDIQGGILDVTSVTALGTGTITSSTASSGVLGLGNGSDEVLANDLTGNLFLVKSGTGSLDLTGTNTYTGGTFIAQGALRVDSFARLGTTQASSSAGTSLILDYNGASQLLQNTVFLTGAGSFIKEGTGDVVLSLASTYTGGTTIREGRLGLNNGAALGTGAIQIDAGAELGVGGIILGNDLTGGGLVRKTANNTVELNGNNSGFTGTIRVEDGDLLVSSGLSLGSGTLQIDNGTTVFINASADSVMAASLTGAGTFEKTGAGRVIVTGNGSQFGGAIAIQNGTLQIEGDQNIGTSAGGVFINALGTLRLDTAGSTNLATVLFGSGNVVKTGSGTVFLTGANTYAGGTDIQQGAIRVTDTSFLGTGPITVQAGAALDLSIAGAQTLSQNITGAGILRKSGGGDLTLLGNGLTGGVDISNGRVIVNTASALGGGPVTTAVDTQLVFDVAGSEVSNTAISGAGAVTKNGSGLLVINNANSYTGGTVINAGRLGLNDGMGLGTGNVIVLQGATLGIGGVTLANNVSGAGQIIKTANNTATLTGTNTHSGGTDIQQGNVVVNSPAALGSGGVQIAAGSQLIVDYNGATNVALANVLSGAGALVKDGSGTVVINTGGNTYSGGTIINAGRLGLNFGDALGTGGVTIASGAELGIGAISLANSVSGGGRIVKTSNGAAFLTGTNSHTGGLDIQGGSVDVTGNGALGTGAVTIASGASLNYFNSAAATFSNGLSGAGTFNKLGAGQLTFANNFTIGALNAAAGRTRINTVATTNATVGANATLDGTGRIIGNLVNNGTVAPGNSIGTLTVQGNYTHNAGSVLEIEFDANGNIDLLDVTGNAVLNGGTIRFVGLGGAEGQGGTFLSTGGTVTGTFATVETVGALLPLSVLYTANTGEVAPSVLTARPSTFNAQSLAAADTALGFIEAIGLADARHGRGNRLWLSGFGAWGDRAASGSTLAYDHETRGISGGVNFDVGSNVTLGAAVGWADGEISLGSNGGSGDQTHTLASLIARWQGTSGLSLGAGALYGEVDQTTLRNVSFNGFSGSVDGATESTLFGGFAEVGIPLGALRGWNFQAGLRGSVIRQEQDGYTESGTSPLRLTLDDLATTTVEGQARLIGTTRLWDATRGAEEDAAGLDLRVDLGLRYLGLQGSREIPVVFAISDAGIVLAGDTRDTLQGAGGIALDYTTSGGARLSLGYRGEFARTDRHTVQAGVSIAF